MEIRDKIIQGAAEQFMLYGVKSVTMDNLANDLAMSKRTIYEHFKNKKELLSAVIDYIHSSLEHDERRMSENSETIIDEFFYLFDSLDERRQRVGKFTLDVLRYYPDIYEKKYHAYHEKAIGRLKERLIKGIEQGVILPELNLELTTYMILEMMYGVINLRERIIRMNIPLVDAFRYTIIHTLRGFSTEKGIALIDRKSKNRPVNNYRAQE